MTATREQWIAQNRKRFQCPHCKSYAVTFALGLLGDFFECLDCGRRCTGTGYFSDPAWHTVLHKRWLRVQNYKQQQLWPRKREQPTEVSK